MLVHCKQQKYSTTSSETLPPLTDKQQARLQYVAGYVLQNLYKKDHTVNSDESQQAMAILKAGKLEISDSQKLVSSLNRGGLCSVILPAQKIFLITKHYFRQSTLKTGLQKNDVVGITHKSTSDGDILANYHITVADAGCKADNDVKKGILHVILSLWVRVRSFSYTKDIVQHYNIKAKQMKGISLYLKKSAEVAKKMTTKGRSETVIVDIYYPSTLHCSYYLTKNTTIKLIIIVSSFSSVESNAKVSNGPNIVSCSGTKMCMFASLEVYQHREILVKSTHQYFS